MRFRSFAATLFLTAFAVALVAQPAQRRATTIAALRAYPGFYHQQTVLILGEVKGVDPRATIGDEEGAIKLIAREVPREGRLEARGQFLDIGRMSTEDPRLIPFNLLDRVRSAYQDRWPKPGEELVLIVGGTAPPPPASDATAPPLRSLAMDPARYDTQKVTITGQFRGRNLFGDLPEAPISSRYQFVLRSGDAAVWVMGVQPKGKTFSFDPTKRIDSGRWVKVQGTVRTAKGLTWLEGTSIELAPTPEETTEVTIDLPPPPPVEILFTAPTQGEGDVKPTERIRMQLSRDLNPATLKDRIRFTPQVAFTANYARESRSLEIRPTESFPAFTPVTMEILEGVTGTDGGAMAPFKLTFTTGGS